MAAEERLSVEVAALDGRVHRFQLRPSHTVAFLKLDLSERIGKPAECLSLVWGTDVLGDAETIGGLGLPSQGACLTLLVRRERLVISGDKDGEVRLWSLDSAACLRAFPGASAQESAAVRAVCVAWDEMLALCGYANGSLRLWDLAQGPCIQTINAHAGPVRGVASDWVRGMALSASEDRHLKLWDLSTGACRQTIACGSPVLAVAVDWVGQQALGAHQNGTLSLWGISAAGGAAIRTLPGHTRVVLALAVDWPARRALSGAVDCRLRLSDLDSGECLRVFVVKQLPRRADAVHTVAMDWPRQRAVSGSGDSSLQLWDLGTGECLHKVEDPLACPVCAVALLGTGGPDDADWAVLAGSSDRRVRLWDLGRGACRKTLVGHAAPVMIVAATTLP